jgi:hypothetical protein
VSYTHWNAGEPNNGGVPGGNEDYTYIYGAGYGPSFGFWNDYQNVADVSPQPPLAGVVELVPEPSSVCVLGVALLFPVMRRKRAGA